MTGPATKKKPSPAKDELETAVATAEGVEIPAESGFLGTDSIDVSTFHDVTIPIPAGKVRVRVLDNIEIAELAVIPDVASYGKLMSDLSLLPADERETRENQQLYSKEAAMYRARVAHIACVSPATDLSVVDVCQECSDEEIEIRHPKALWSIDKTRRLDPRSLQIIVAAAENEEDFRRRAPFSATAAARSASSPAADTGESTPPTNSG